MRVPIVALVSMLIACSPAPTSPTAQRLEGAQPAISGDRLVESIGIETLGGVFLPLLRAGCELPCKETYSFSTAEDQQRSIDIRLYRGVVSSAEENHFLGRFSVTEISPAPRGVPNIDVTIEAKADGVYFSAHEQSNRGLRVTRIE